MAIIKNFKTGEEIEVKDGSEIRNACEELGIPFGCRNGNCGTCIIDVKEGMENLSERNVKEDAMGLDGDYRLACQCKIKSDKVVIDF